ncbi:MarR family transcriptional regulator [Streptomyces sp. NBC_00015]|uniref:MarR family winged helix-turn-helix transcriptional regulator n=1 Tax=unclassified Streptomyces TaxID=2593676 RepID=UPI0022550A59|nr:MarR family transcriptional regulator [Streptomyces sp. NBC_00103]MCX5373932.1 MarR family transcriptional regulator [Streptomyces sp. NBC_00103]
MNEASKWLTPEEQDAWRSVVRMQEKLGGRLSRCLQSGSGLSAADYAVLLDLAGAPGGRMRHVDLARCLDWEKSRMSHQISRMVKRGLVAREGCPDDGRGAFVVITPAGREVIAVAAPLHMEAVRRLFIDLLAPDELRLYASVANRVVARMEERSSVRIDLARPATADGVSVE